MRERERTATTRAGSGPFSRQGARRSRSWSHSLDEKGDHRPVNKELRIEGKLPLGAYLLEAKSGSHSARDLVLVTDSSLVLKSSAKQALVYFCNALTGAPISNASIALWESYYVGDKWHWRKIKQTTDRDGLAVFNLKDIGNYRNLFASAAVNESQAFSVGYSHAYGQDTQPWRIYAFTDRPAYRPKETVQWKFIARHFVSGVYSTPANQVVEYEINDPRGTKVSEGKATLNTFGSAWGSLELKRATTAWRIQGSILGSGPKQQYRRRKAFSTRRVQTAGVQGVR